MSAITDNDELRMLTSEDVASLQTANSRCCDCGTAHPSWASLCHGTLICLQCAGKHRSLGVGVSKVRSLTMDAWSEEQLQRVQMGGNASAQSYFKSAFVKHVLQMATAGATATGAPPTGPTGATAGAADNGNSSVIAAAVPRYADWIIASKYDSNVGEAYRARLDLLVQGIDVSNIPAPAYHDEGEEGGEEQFRSRSEGGNTSPTQQRKKEMQQHHQCCGHETDMVTRKAKSSCADYFFGILFVPCTAA